MTNKLYALTHGEYSDYRILTLCSSKERAEELAKWYNAKKSIYEDEVEVEEYDDGLVVPDENLNTYRIWFDEKGNPKSCEQGHPIDAVNNRIGFNKNGGYVYLFATDMDSARKIAIDKRAKWIAEHLGEV